MLKLVIGLNIAIAFFGFYLAWRIWQIKRVLMSVTVVLTSWERNTHRVLNPNRTPDWILQGQQATVSARQKYADLEKQLQQLQQIFSVALIGVRLLRSHVGTQQRRARNQ